MDKQYKKHSNVKNQMILEANKYPGVKLWPNPLGLGWVSNPKTTRSYTKNGKKYVVLENPIKVKFGLCKGSLDAIGYKIEQIDIYKIPRFIAFDAKTEAYPNFSPQQQNYHDLIINSGGIAGKIKKPGEVTKLLGMPLLRV